MKPLPRPVLDLLETLPEETCKVILNTNQKGHWVVEVFTRYTIIEEIEDRRVHTRQTLCVSSTQ